METQTLARLPRSWSDDMDLEGAYQCVGPDLRDGCEEPMTRGNTTRYTAYTAHYFACSKGHRWTVIQPRERVEP